MKLLGAHPDPVDSRDWRFEDSRIAALSPLTGVSSFDYRDHDTPRIQIANSCVGHAIAGAAALSMAIVGTHIAFPSALYAYAGARLLSGRAWPMVDGGCSTRYAMTWIRERGLVAEDRWPEDGDLVNVVPPLDAFQEGECATIESFYRIDAGHHAPELIRAALARGYCPLFVMTVDEAYANTGREIYDEPGGKVLGGHAQVVVGYSAILDAFLVRNTWGLTFGIEGYAWISASVAASRFFDVWVIQTAPPVF